MSRAQLERPRPQGRRARSRRRRAAGLSARLCRRARRRGRFAAVPSRSSAKPRRLIAPAHPGCAGSDELADGCSIDDVVFHYSRSPRRARPAAFRSGRTLRRRLDRGRACGAPSGADCAAGPDRRLRPVRAGRADRRRVHACAAGARHRLPDRCASFCSPPPTRRRHCASFPTAAAISTRRCAAIRCCASVPSSASSRPTSTAARCADRLHRAAMPALVVWGEDDRMVPRAHGEAYAAGLPGAGALEPVKDCGHAVLLQQPQAAADLVLRFLHHPRIHQKAREKRHVDAVHVSRRRGRIRRLGVERLRRGHRQPARALARRGAGDGGCRDRALPAGSLPCLGDDRRQRRQYPPARARRRRFAAHRRCELQEGLHRRAAIGCRAPTS